MAKQQVKTTDKKVKKPVAPVQPTNIPFLFGRRNYMMLIIGLAILAIGFLLMTGGSQPPTQFDPAVVYGFRRTTLSTIFVTIGLGVVLYSIFQKHSAEEVQ